jgi:hypothetical protein
MADGRRSPDDFQIGSPVLNSALVEVLDALGGVPVERRIKPTAGPG